jgi:SnoaL-like domain
VATTEELIDMLRQGGVLQGGRTVRGNEMIDLASPLLEAYATPDFVTVMTSESATREHRGLDGYREALTDWISPYEAFRFEIEEVIVKDDRLVFLARQVATTKHQESRSSRRAPASGGSATGGSRRSTSTSTSRRR